jgi:hypothetical protein
VNIFAHNSKKEKKEREVVFDEPIDIYHEWNIGYIMTIDVGGYLHKTNNEKKKENSYMIFNLINNNKE